MNTRITEGLLIIGIICLAVGAWWIHPAAGMLTIGATVTAVSIGLRMLPKKGDE